MTTLELQLSCRTCNRTFPASIPAMLERGLKNIPRRCPSCTDYAQKRPEIAESTVCLREWPAVRLVSFPAARGIGWALVQHSPGRPLRETEDADRADWVLDIRGRDLGEVAWSGRIVLRAPETVFAESPWPGTLVGIREMESTRRVRLILGSRTTLQNGSAPTRCNVGMHDPRTDEEIVAGAEEVAASHDTRAIPDSFHVERILETRRYLVLGTRAAEDQGLSLYWLRGRSKETLKGYGRQYHDELLTDAADAAWPISASCRSGRITELGALVIARPGVCGVRHREDGNEDVVWAGEAAPATFAEPDDDWVDDA